MTGINGQKQKRRITEPQSENAVTRAALLDLIEEQEYGCALSGVELTPETATADHIHPCGLGGEHTIQNIQILDKRVNVMKGTLPQDEFIDLCCRVAQYAGGLNDELELQADRGAG